MSKPVFYNNQTSHYRFNCNANQCHCFHYIYETEPAVNQSEKQKQVSSKASSYVIFQIKTFLNK